MLARILHPSNLASLTRGSTARALALISTLTKLNTSPTLLRKALEKEADTVDQEDTDGIARSAFKQALDLIPSDTDSADVSLSGKSVVLLCLSSND